MNSLNRDGERNPIIDLLGSYYDYQANESIKNSIEIANTLKKCFIVFTITLPIIVIYFTYELIK